MVAKVGRPKSENPRRNNTRLRMTDEEVAMLEYCAEQTGKTKTEILMLGLEKVYNEIKKQPRTPIAKQSVLSYRSKETLSEIIISEKSFFVIPQRSFYNGKKSFKNRLTNADNSFIILMSAKVR